MLLLEIIVILLCILIGARKGGVAMGFASGVGIFILTFVFGLKPSSPPINVLLIIIAISSMAATLQVAGGLEFLVSFAEKVLRSKPSRITLMAPLVCFIFTVFTGTSYVALAVFPVICEVAMEAKIRVERPMSISFVAAAHAISASPVSAATAALLSVLAIHGVTLGQIMAVSIPAITCGIIIGAISVYRKGVELEDDPEFQRRLASGELSVNTVAKNYKPTLQAKLSVALFGLGVFLIVLFGSVPSLTPSWVTAGKVTRLSIPNMIEMIGFAISFVMVMLCGVKPGQIPKSGVFTGGMTGVVAIFGVAWMTDTFFMAHRQEFIDTFGALVQQYPILFGVVVFIMSALLLSQGATTRSVMPMGLSLGLAPHTLVGLFPAVNGLFFFPATGTAISAITFDRTGTTQIGKYVLNHSFQRPGFVTCITSCLIGLVLANFII